MSELLQVFVIIFVTLLATLLSACSGNTTEPTKAMESSIAPTEIVTEEAKETEKATAEENTEVSVPIVSSNIKYILVDRAPVYEAGSEELLSDSAIIDYLDKCMEIEVIQKVSDLYTKVYYSDGVGYVLNSDFGEYADLVIVHENDTSIDSEPETEYIKTENNKETEPDEGDSPIEAWAQEVDDPFGGSDGCVDISGTDQADERSFYEKTQMPVFAYSSLSKAFFTGKVKSSEPENAASLLDQYAVKGFCHPEYKQTYSH